MARRRVARVEPDRGLSIHAVADRHQALGPWVSIHAPHAGRDGTSLTLLFSISWTTHFASPHRLSPKCHRHGLPNRRKPLNPGEMTTSRIGPGIRGRFRSAPR